MKAKSYSIQDAVFERSPGQDGDIFAANLVDQRDDAPVTIGYGRYGPNQTLTETMAVDDVMIILEGRLSVTSDGVTQDAGPGAIVHMPKGVRVTIRTDEVGANTAYVTYPHWQVAR